MDRPTDPGFRRLRVSLIAVHPMVRRALVGPIGCERLAGALLAAYPDRVETFLTVPFLQRAWTRALQRDLARASPDLVCLSFRNLDECVYLGPNWEERRPRLAGVSFFPSLEQAVAVVRESCEAPILIGGTGFACAPHAILRRLSLRFGVVGPGEPALVEWVGRVLSGEDAFLALERMAGRLGVVDADRPHIEAPAPTPLLFGPVVTPRHPGMLQAIQLAQERVAVVVAYGCRRRCAFCIEPSLLGGGAIARPIEDIVSEIRFLSERGVRRFWLACSEINACGTDPTSLFRAIARLRIPGLDLRTYLCVGRVDDDLLDAMEEAGQRPWEQSFEMGHLAEGVLATGWGPAALRSIEDLAERFLRRGYPMLGGTIVLGGPEETEATLLESARRANALDRAFPEGFGLSVMCGVRLYPTSRVGRRVLADPGPHRAFLHPRSRRAPGDGVRPLFYSRPHAPPALARVFREAVGVLKGGLRFMTSVWREKA